MEDKIFSVRSEHFDGLALEVFHFQYAGNPVYRSWVDTLGVNPHEVTSVERIPYLPISFFKTHNVTTTSFEPEVIFESSGTTGTINSKHFVKTMTLYENSFMKGFELFYGKPENYVILGLLPSYLERKNSSLVAMVDALVNRSNRRESGFYLYEHEQLERVLVDLAQKNQPAMLFGVTFALLDFATNRELFLPQTIVMETGGMKGRKEELTRVEVHTILKKKLHTDQIHSEYGMTELLSQAYSKMNGIFQTPPWMRIVLRDEEDPLTLRSMIDTKPSKGVINIIDLANLYSCAFIATDDLGTMYPQGFSVDGRLDKSDLRGCSLLTV